MDHLLIKTMDHPCLSDVPTTIARHELQLLVAKAQKSVNCLHLKLALHNGSTLDLEVLSQWTVAQLKRLVERTITVNAEKTMGKWYKISWKKHWKRWVLVYDGTPLDDGRRQLHAYGLVSSGTLHFTYKPL